MVADTHIPDRAQALHPGLLPALRAAGVERILHAGDITTPAVIAELAQVAPVDIARGNRDWSFGDAAPMVNHLVLAGVPVALMHGHISWLHYLLDKFFYIFQGYLFRRYQPFLLHAGNDARVIVFGHTHHIENEWVQGRLLFNPGSAGIGFWRISGPTWGLLRFYAGGEVEGEILQLKGFRLVKRRWVRDSLEFS